MSTLSSETDPRRTGCGVLIFLIQQIRLTTKAELSEEGFRTLFPVLWHCFSDRQTMSINIFSDERVKPTEGWPLGVDHDELSGKTMSA